MIQEKIELFDVKFNNATMPEFLELLTELIAANTKNNLIQTVNVDHIMLMREDPEFDHIVRNAALITCDGMPIVWASKFKSVKLPERVTGADMTLEIFKHSAAKDFKVFILGAGPGVAELAAEKARETFEGVQITGVYSPAKEELQDADASQAICRRVNESGANILLIALGAPKQEKWYWKNREFLEVNAIIGVGASIDFIAGTQERAPVWMQNAGMEWSYRLMKNPNRMFQRYIVRDSKFLPLFIKEIIKK
ncbi:WecB/TagA/CpsF family glycosyltransferase [Planococcus sp. X10-3]|uniref:WecB/TagA/CpsF family glycosyltransferase n=1 Tax=Planococcus sp. X10-3 TaxID=3061240 RepID=UPI003BAE948E